MKKLLLVLSVILLITICFVGCETYPEYEYADEYVRVENHRGSGWLVSGNLATTTSDGVNYKFDKTLTERERAVFIDRQSKICRMLEDNGIDTEGLNIFAVKDIYSRALGEQRTAYVDFSLTGTSEQIGLTLQALLGEYTNYGYIYALSCHVAESLGWESNNDTDVTGRVFLDTPPLLNLVYPCFDGVYATQEEIAACEALSVELLERMESPFVGEAAFIAEISHYADEEGIDYKRTYLTFAYGGDGCPVKIRTQYLDVYLDSDYTGDINLPEEDRAGDPMFNLSDMIAFFEYSDESIADIRESFGQTSEALVTVNICTINYKFPGGADYGGYFYQLGEEHYIELAYIYSLTHEYTHYLDWLSGTEDSSWCAEVLACYYGASFDFASRIAYAEYVGDSYIDELSYIIGRRYDSVDDEILFQHIMTVYYYRDKLKYSVTGLYDGRLSFGDYFVRTYGEQTFIQCMLVPTRCLSLTGKTMDSVLEDWCEWILIFE